MKTKKIFILLILAAFFTGCASIPPKELVDARAAYRQASAGPAEQLAPAELHKANEALTLAEQSFRKDPDSYKTKDLAYAAQRKSELAGARGAMAADKSSKEKADAAFQKKQTEIVKQGKQDLSDSEKRTTAAQAELDKRAAVKASKDEADAAFQKQQAEIAQGKQALRESEKQASAAQAELDKRAAVKASEEKAAADLQKQQAEIAQGKQALSDSEKRTAEAMTALAALAAVREEERGSVVTLSGGVLFLSAQSTLLSSAKVKLNQVADALLAVRARNLIVEGYTDSRGTESYNQGLSQRRADSVRDYLVQRGYPSNRIQASGKGEGGPIADNASAEGRANNRRVAIVIER